MKAGSFHRRWSVVLVAAVALAMTTLSGAATAQTDPYTGNSIPPTVTGAGGSRPSLSINVLETEPGKQVLLSGCGFSPGQFLRITLNPGTTANPGAPCANAPVPVQRAAAGAGATLERLRFESLAQSHADCTFEIKTNADPPDTTAGGGIGSTHADAKGCVAVWQTVPKDLKAGSYELCAAATGLETVCAVLKLTTVDGSAGGRGLARTGLTILPWVIAALIAIMVGRELVKRSRRSHGV